MHVNVPTESSVSKGAEAGVGNGRAGECLRSRGSGTDVWMNEVR